VKRKIILSVFSMFLVIGLSTYVASQSTNKTEAPKLSKAARDEVESIDARAKQIAPRLASSDKAEAKKAEAEWDTLSADLTAWAKKHKVKFQTRKMTPEAAIAAGGIGVGGLHKCPRLSCPEPGFCCELVEEGPGLCRYRCYPY
jgi:hypothetical protein